MARRVDLWWMPGLCSGWIEQGWLPGLERIGGARARLRGAFPCLPATLEATLLTGLPPGRHGCLGQEAFADRPPFAAAGIEAWPEVTVHRSLDLWRALCRDGFPSAAVQEALQSAGATLAAAATAAGDDHVALVCGGPSFQAQPRRISLGSLAGARTLAEGGILRVVAPDTHWEAVRRELLRTPGVERVLNGRGLALWGADHPQAGDLVAVAEPGWTFTDEAIAYGSWEEGLAPALLLGIGGQPRWPADVHDVRIAPTVARIVGRPTSGFADSPLDL